MAWRVSTRKVAHTFLGNGLAVHVPSSAFVSKSYSKDTIQSIIESKTLMPGSLVKLQFLCALSHKALTRMPLMRYFHASLGSLAKRNVGFALKTPRRTKNYVKKDRTQPPTEVRYVPPVMKKTKQVPAKTIDIFEGMTVAELSKRTGKSITDLQSILINVGEKAYSMFDTLSIDVAELVAMEVGVNVKRLHASEGSKILPRPPVVTVMGHVDHGKTSLLDALRQTSLASKEAGGITQHLGAFVVSMQSGASITFLDTPGHAAFSAMRARGAAVTDIVVLVVAADDGVMPQTLEAMSHAKSANVPIVVAINKCDKPGANPDRVKVQLASEGLALEEMGGDIQVVEVSAAKKTGLDSLEEALLLQAEMMELKARIDGPAQAYVVEARLDKGRGPLATAIVKAGTLVCGQHVVVGAEWGRIRAIRDTIGNFCQKAKPAMPVEIEGLKGLPMAGDDIVVVESEERARMLSSGRKKKLETDRLLKIEQERTETVSPTEEATENVELPVIVKADVQGTVQAVTDSLRSLTCSQVSVNVVHVGVGPISESDLALAKACNACIVGFNIRSPPNSVVQEAERDSIKIILHRVIYHLLKDIGELIVEKAPGTLETKVAGEAQVLGIFELKGRSKSKGPDVKIAGCKVVTGHVSKTSLMKVLRSGEVIFEGVCSSLKQEQQDVEMVSKGKECGLVIQDCLDFQIGDVIQCWEENRRKPKFISSDNGVVRIEC
ncbi:unnamed protein product [Amaranthus hypochondriacus]